MLRAVSEVTQVKSTDMDDWHLLQFASYSGTAKLNLVDICSMYLTGLLTRLQAYCRSLVAETTRHVLQQGVFAFGLLEVNAFSVFDCLTNPTAGDRRATF